MIIIDREYYDFGPISDPDEQQILQGVSDLHGSKQKYFHKIFKSGDFTHGIFPSRTFMGLYKILQLLENPKVFNSTTVLFHYSDYMDVFSKYWQINNE